MKKLKALQSFSLADKAVIKDAEFEVTHETAIILVDGGYAELAENPEPKTTEKTETAKK
jgi:hypothetical protein